MKNTKKREQEREREASRFQAFTLNIEIFRLPWCKRYKKELFLCVCCHVQIDEITAIHNISIASNSYASLYAMTSHKNTLRSTFVNCQITYSKRLNFYKCSFGCVEWGGQLSLIKSNRSVDRIILLLVSSRFLDRLAFIPN